MKRYVGTKIIYAEPAKKGEDDGYFVQYPDGYTSWSPKQAFEEAYRESSGLTFGLALEALKKGERIARAGWNGKGMFLYLIKGVELQQGLRYGFGEYMNEPEFASSICMKTADNKLVVGWLASQTDMLAEDWMLVD